jgi:molybdate transport system substrate-binding protein
MDATTPVTIKVQCTNGLKSVLVAIEAGFARETGITMSPEFASTKKLLDTIAASEAADAVILTDEAINALIAQQRLQPGRTDLARSLIGVAVRKGTPHPDIGSRDAFLQTLKNAKSISRSRAGISGLHIAALLEQLGLAQELSPKIKVYDGFAAQACANGETEIAIQQISELMPVEGLDIVGPLPAELQKETMFSAGIGKNTQQAAAAAALIAYLKAGERTPVLRAKGLEPA